MSAVGQDVRWRAATSGVTVRAQSLSVAAAVAALVLVQPGLTVAAADPGTAVTFAITSGELTLSVPASADLGSGRPGTQISGKIGTVAVTDDRALASASWTVTASETDFTTGGATLPAGSAAYDPGSITTTGTITATGTPVTLSHTATPVVTGSNGVGDNTATWNPKVTVSLPAGAIGGVYNGTLTQSVA
ncbi:hypothetical protein ACFYZE_00070 [Streptomyces sp. NPDC001796]|uniref:hypothetical protein n=1 Tax=Streptomyces sp. NPDC001796 TaxID=3364609 RepID=UPI0036775376